MENKAQTGGHKTVAIERDFNLAKDTVWKAWTEPESFKKWWGPTDYSCPDCRIDLKLGGKYIASMKGPDGKEIYSSGIYKEIVPGKKLVVTDNFSDSEGNTTAPPEGMPGDWSQELVVTVELSEKNGKTHMSLKHEGLPAEMHDDCIVGWNQSFDKMEAKLK